MERFNYWQPCDPQMMHLLASAAPPFIAKMHCHDRLRRDAWRRLELKTLQKKLSLRIVVRDERILCWLSVDALPEVPVDCSSRKVNLAEQLLEKFNRSTTALQTEVNMACLQVFAAVLEWHMPEHILRKFRSSSLSCQAELCMLLSMLCGFDENEAHKKGCEEYDECNEVCWDAWDSLTRDPRHRTKTYLQDIFYEPDHIWHKFRKSSSSCLLLLRDLCWSSDVPDEDRLWCRAHSSAPWDDHFRYYGFDEYGDSEEFDDCEVYDGAWDEPESTDEDSVQVLVPLLRDARRTMETHLQDSTINHNRRLAKLAANAEGHSCEKLKRGQHQVEGHLLFHGGRHKVDARSLVQGVDY